MSNPQHLDRYCGALTTLRADTVDSLRALCAPQIRFRDPFQDVRGVDAYLDILRSMYHRLGPVTFTIHDRTAGPQQSYLWWTLVWGAPTTSPIEGTSRIGFDADGLVAEHADYWDAASQIYERAPILGSVLRIIRRRLAG